MTEDTKPTNYSFEHKGETFTFEHDFDVIRSPKWLRQNRRRDEVDLTFTILESVAGDDALAAIDDMGEDEFIAFAKALDKAIGVSLGK